MIEFCAPDLDVVERDAREALIPSLEAFKTDVGEMERTSREFAEVLTDNLGVSGLLTYLQRQATLGS